jgi:gamma-glutamylcyclotransferase (GGCT)/AIG2-like uncharacterized protein YtfP
MPLLFSYGTLRQEEVQRATLGRALLGREDAILGFESVRVPIEDPRVVAALGATHHANALFNGRDESRISGIVLEVTNAELAVVDAYEAPFSYRRRRARLASGGEAWVYVHAPAG